MFQKDLQMCHEEWWDSRVLPFPYAARPEEKGKGEKEGYLRVISTHRGNSMERVCSDQPAADNKAVHTCNITDLGVRMEL